jgi:hypothetical protein
MTKRKARQTDTSVLQRIQAPTPQGFVRSVHYWPTREPSGSPWLVALDWTVQAGRYECVGMSIRSFEEAKTQSIVPLNPLFGFQIVDTGLLRSVRLGELIEEGLADHISLIDEHKDLLTQSLPSEEAQRDLDEFRERFRRSLRRRKGGRPLEWGPDRLSEVARTYMEAWAERKKPTQAVAKRFGVSYSTAAKAVARARQARLLPKTSQGKATAAVKAPTKMKPRRRKQ